jgi:hypothetical protein
MTIVGDAISMPHARTKYNQALGHAVPQGLMKGVNFADKSGIRSAPLRSGVAARRCDAASAARRQGRGPAGSGVGHSNHLFCTTDTFVTQVAQRDM